MHKRKKQLKNRILALLTVLVCFVSIFGLCSADVSAATGTLTVKAGFYGGPYYKVKALSKGRMSSMSGPVYTYTGVDSGGFMRVCYAYGVTFSKIIESAGVDLDSVKYIYMGTEDKYGESYSTFLANQLVGSRKAYPHMVDLVDKKGGSQQTLDFSKVTSKITSGAKSVPTILAVGNSGFSREEAVYAGKNGFRKMTKSKLKFDGYRLVYGQAGLSNLSEAQNVQKSDKWVYEVNLQLTGSPGIDVEKELIEGEDGEIGARYALHVNINLPASYGYLSKSIRKKLEQQILEKLRLNGYDESVVVITKSANGEYIAEIVGEGDTTVRVNYSRREYGGGIISARGTASFSIGGGGSSGGGGGSGGTGGEGSTDSTESGDGSRDNTSPTGSTDSTQPATEPATEATQPATEPATEATEATEPATETSTDATEETTEPDSDETDEEETTATSSTKAAVQPTTKASTGAVNGEDKENRYLGLSDKNGEEKAESEDSSEPKDTAEVSAEKVQWVAAESLESSSEKSSTPSEEGGSPAVLITCALALLGSGAGGTVALYRRRK